MAKDLAFFGAFNPPTAAHLDLALFALERTGAERAVFVPSKAEYILDQQRKDFAYSDAERLGMLTRAAETRPWMHVTDWELRQDIQPRSYVTLCRLREMGYDPALLVGSDKLPELERWVRAEALFTEFGVVCLERGGDRCEDIIAASAFLTKMRDRIRVIATPAGSRQISSTRVRQCVAGIRALEKELAALVPPDILPLVIGREADRP